MFSLRATVAATTGGPSWAKRWSWALFVACALSACDSGLDPTPSDGSPPGLDVLTPFPIDRGDEGIATPGKYKGLWLRLVDNGPVTVTPVDGVIGVVCLGFSNARQECGDFIARINSHWIGDVSYDVRVMNCGRQGHAIEHWISADYDHLWQECRDGLWLVGLRPNQIRVVYHKAANGVTTFADGSVLPEYPDAGSDYEVFYENLTSFSVRVPLFFPTVQAVYTSSRSYGGFAQEPGRAEPLSYEEGHALNSWLRDNPSLDGLWHGWGAYLWARPCPTGETNGGGVCYQRRDFQEDGVALTGTGAGKISFLMHFRLMREDWYRRR